MAKSSTMRPYRHEASFARQFVQSPERRELWRVRERVQLAGIEGRVALADSLLGEGTGQKGLTHTAGAKQDEILMSMVIQSQVARERTRDRSSPLAGR